MGITGNFLLMGARDGGERPNPHGGTLKRWYCKFQGADGATYDDVYWSRKPDSPVEPGQSYYGEMDQSDKGWRFFTRQQPNGAPPAAVQQAAGAPSAPQPVGDDRQNRIERQHAHEMALRLVAATGDAKDLNLGEQEIVGAYLTNVVKRLTDWFQRDTARTPTPPRAPAPAQTTEPTPPPPEPVPTAVEAAQADPDDAIPF